VSGFDYAGALRAYADAIQDLAARVTVLEAALEQLGVALNQEVELQEHEGQELPAS
jgi:hypothetical protein